MSRNAIAVAALMFVTSFAGCATVARGEDVAAVDQITPFPAWNADGPDYRYYPGDELAIAVPGAPEFDRTVTIAPDGRIRMPQIAAVMAAARTSGEIESALQRAYTQVLRDPRVQVTPKSFASRQIFVGGEVEKPGVYELAPGADPMQAVIQAGGFRDSARRQDVLILRRELDGASSVYKADLSGRAFREGLVQLGTLERFDVLFVPKSRIAQVGLFMRQYVRDALPLQFSFYYNLAPDGR